MYQDVRRLFCPELSDAFIQGHILKDRFKDVWDNKYKILRNRSWTRKNECADCSVYEICSRGPLHLYSDTKSHIARYFYLLLGGKQDEEDRSET